MTQTATRSKSARPTAVAEPRALETEVGRAGKFLLDKLANARIMRLMAARDEEKLKEKWAAIWRPLAEAEGLQKGDVLVIKASGVARGRVTMRGRGKQVDLDLLLAGWPEAFEACVSDAESLQYDSL